MTSVVDVDDRTNTPQKERTLKISSSSFLCSFKLEMNPFFFPDTIKKSALSFLLERSHKRNCCCWQLCYHQRPCWGCQEIGHNYFLNDICFILLQKITLTVINYVVAVHFPRHSCRKTLRRPKRSKPNYAVKSNLHPHISWARNA